MWGLRLIPNHFLIRPCNLDETIKAFEIALNSNKAPYNKASYSIITSRQEFELPVGNDAKVSRCAYVIKSDRQAQINILATGSEVNLAYSVSAILDAKHNVKANIVSIPCVEMFSHQIQSY